MNLRAMPWAGLALLLVASCGGSEESTPEVPEERQTSGSERTEERREGGPQITGLMGTIRADQVEHTLQPRVQRMARCFSTRMSEIEQLGGSIRLGFRIHTDGTVAWVYPLETDIGDRATEQCILEQASRARFPRPRGGEAEFTWGFGLDPSPDIRPPLTWGADSLGRRADDVRGLARQCRVHAAYQITAYVEPGGTVLAAGGSAPGAAELETLDCVLEGVRGWTFTDPGSYPAKISFPVR